MELHRPEWRPLGVDDFDAVSFKVISRGSFVESVAAMDAAPRLLEALAHGDIHVHYQPLVDLRTGVTVRLEALARWFAIGGSDPDRFVPAAEATGTVAVLDLHVLAAASRQLAAWRGAGRDVRVSTNFSQRSLIEPGMVDRILSIVEDGGARPEWIDIEVTETARAPLGPLADAIAELRGAGLRIALDDFGTRYSFLGQLMSIGADELKIDRSFTQRLPDPTARIIIGSMIALAVSLDLAVVVEGIETTEQLEAVRDLGCSVAQGFLFSPALDAAAATIDLTRIHDVSPPDSPQMALGIA